MSNMVIQILVSVVVAFVPSLLMLYIKGNISKENQLNLQIQKKTESDLSKIATGIDKLVENYNELNIKLLTTSGLTEKDIALLKQAIKEREKDILDLQEKIKSIESKFDTRLTVVEKAIDRRSGKDDE